MTLRQRVPDQDSIGFHATWHRLYDAPLYHAAAHRR
jgi:hypothetical protein